MLKALASLKEVTNYLYRLNLILKAVFYLSSLAMWILWKAWIMLTLVNYLAMDIWESVL